MMTEIELAIHMRTKRQQKLIDDNKCMIYVYDKGKCIDKLVVSFNDLAQTIVRSMTDAQAYNFFKRDKLVKDTIENAM